MGDGMMALFGVDLTCPMQSCLDAVSAGLDMLEELQTLNHYLETHFGHKISIGIGIDFGEALVGDLRHPEKKALTAIGNTVNVVARIEAATKYLNARLLVSDSVFCQVKKHVKRHLFSILS
jgi:adenylate cyclase